MRDKLGRFKKGNVGWNIGQKNGTNKKCLICGKPYYAYPHLKEKRKYCSRRCVNKSKMGKSNLRKGVQYTKKEGYVFLYNPSHPFCNSQGYVRRSRLVMEKHLGRYLRPVEVMHHKGIKYPLSSIKNKQDDRIENLELFATNGNHSRFHSSLRRRDKHGQLTKKLT